jgi:hypothetical protein
VIDASSVLAYRLKPELQPDSISTALIEARPRLLAIPVAREVAILFARRTATATTIGAPISSILIPIH